MPAGDPNGRCFWCGCRGRDHRKSQYECEWCGNCTEYEEDNR